MNGDKYKPIIEQYENASSAKEQRQCLFTMVCMIATNHLHDIEEKQEGLKADVKEKIKKLQKVTIGIGIAILLAILFSDQISLMKIVEFIAKVL